uniref:Piwi domain-containing protein n=1 Tax=Mycena chlorophos TaxID=658473 RepID=A0ABQ0M8L9_MYCCL|nr:predicted protein [Mycena chlorophos]
MATPVVVASNCFEISRLPDKLYFQYTLSFDPASPKRPKRERLVEALQTSVAPSLFTKRALFDGTAILWTQNKVSDQTFRVHDSNQAAPPTSLGWYSIVLSRTRGKEISPAVLTSLTQMDEPTPESAAALNLLQLLLTHELNQLHPSRGRSYFFLESAQNLGALPLDLVRGFYQAIRLTRGARLLLTVDITTAVVYPSGSVMAFALRILESKDARRLEIRDRAAQDFRKLRMYLVGRAITVEPSGRRKIIRDLLPGPAGDYEFEFNNIQTTVSEYFYRVHSRRLAYPRTIGIIISTKRDPFLQLPSEAIAEMVEFSTLPPQQRQRLITGGGAHVTSPIQHHLQSQVVADAGMQLNPRPSTAEARLLRIPTVILGDTRFQPVDGAYNMKGHRLASAANMDNWAILNVSGTGPQVTDATVGYIRRGCDRLGMQCTPPKLAMNATAYSLQDAASAVKEVLRNLDHRRPSILMLVLPGPADVYNRLKHVCDIQYGVSSQGVLASKAREGKDPYFASVLLKVNARLGGINAVVNSAFMNNSKSPYIIMGADVAHPSQGSSLPSMAAVVWSIDKTCTRFSGASRAQPARQETLEGLDLVTVMAYTDFFAENPQSKPPDQLIFLRDGVSEGEFKQTIEVEVAGIQRAFDLIRAKRDLWSPELLSVWKPKLTFIVVGKRHHVSFTPLGPESNLNGNCRPGLVVDGPFTNRYYPNFFMIAHPSLKGTARAIHCTLLLDQVFNKDLPRVEELCQDLCYSFARATKAVSLPAPVYYAHLWCRRLSIHISPESELMHGSEGSSADGTSASGPTFDQWTHEFKEIQTRLRLNMPFL